MSTTIIKASSSKTPKSLVVLTPNQIYNVQSTDTGVAGSPGSTVVLLDSANWVALSGAIANLDLSQSIFNYSFISNGVGVHMCTQIWGICWPISAVAPVACM